MNSGQLLNRTLANRLLCETQQIAIGPTGPTGTIGPVGPINTYAIKAFTIFIVLTNAGITQVRIPAGLFSTSATGANPSVPRLSEGGVYTANQGTDLQFFNTNVIDLERTQYGFPIGITASGYYPAAGAWSPIAGTNIGTTKLHYATANDNTVSIAGITIGFLQGTTGTDPSTGNSGSGYSASITLFYL
jgi:hypothetical protein